MRHPILPVLTLWWTEDGQQSNHKPRFSMSESRAHIAIVGAGQLGSRHLQGLTKINQAIDITVIEPNPYAMDLAKKRYDEMPVNPLVRSISCVSSLKGISQDLDLAIIVTNADVRRKVIENLLGKIQIKYLILEKVVFQSVRDFETVIRILDEKHAKAWVNCPRRIVPFFRNIREEMITADKVQIIVEGSKWGMASNAIHMLDLFAFLTGQTEICIDGTGLDHKIYESKRSEFLELGGVLEAENSRGDKLTLIDEKNSAGQNVLSMSSRNHRYIINNSNGRVFSAHKEDGWEEKEELFQMPLQSELTHLAVHQILDTGKCDITPIKESYVLHKPMLEAFNIHLSKINGVKYKACPIT